MDPDRKETVGVVRSEIEDLVVVLDEIAPVAGVARADSGKARRAEVDSIDVLCASDLPRSIPIGVGGACVEESLVACLHLRDQRRLRVRRVLDGAELQQHGVNTSQSNKAGRQKDVR